MSSLQSRIQTCSWQAIPWVIANFQLSSTSWARNELLHFSKYKTFLDLQSLWLHFDPIRIVAS